jgi:hypothetical protein
MIDEYMSDDGGALGLAFLWMPGRALCFFNHVIFNHVIFPPRLGLPDFIGKIQTPLQGPG